VSICALLQASLRELAFQNVGCSIRACQAVAELVKHPQELRRLHLYNNMSDDAGAAAIAQAIPMIVFSCFIRRGSTSAKIRSILVDSITT